jgi:hypothetical protein
MSGIINICSEVENELKKFIGNDFYNLFYLDRQYSICEYNTLYVVCKKIKNYHNGRFFNYTIGSEYKCIEVIDKLYGNNYYIIGDYKEYVHYNPEYISGKKHCQFNFTAKSFDKYFINTTIKHLRKEKIEKLNCI